MIKDALKLPSWALYILIITTVVLSLVILAKVWFPYLLDDEIFLKIVLTYAIVIASSAVIAKIANYIKEIEDNSND